MALKSGQLSFLIADTLRPHSIDFVSTRFQGSKKRLTDWIWENVSHLDFDSVLDLFGGTGSVSHMFKAAGKAVVYNDMLRFNWHIGRALIENNATYLSEQDTETILTRHDQLKYPSFIADTFRGIYFTSAENAWLDQANHNIETMLDDEYKKCIARFALYQACIIKRPYNLFHRSNLYMREADVKRSFGNKTTWNKPFETFFRKFVREANRAVFDNAQHNIALNSEALDVDTADCDLVYIDPPYVPDGGSATDYFAFYQFLEGLADYENWPARIDRTTKHLAIPSPTTPWVRRKEVVAAFDAVLEKCCQKKIVISYRDDGIPSIEVLTHKLMALGKKPTIHRLPQKYVLSTRSTHEVLIVAA
jgi:adenine-specific DNA-methyltransferase